jgi:hypothetical protein
MTILKQLRQTSGRDPADLAAAGGISLPSYFDLEARESELIHAATIDTIVRIARELGVKPSSLYGGASDNTVSLNELAQRVLDCVKCSGRSLPEIEEEIGWSIASALANPAEFREMNADCLKAVADIANLQWLEVLDGL